MKLKTRKSRFRILERLEGRRLLTGLSFALHVELVAIDEDGDWM